MLTLIMTLQDRITELLDESGKSGSELARYCNISRGAVSRWRTGTVQDMEGKTAFKVAKFFGVNVEWLQTGKGPKYPPKHMGDDEKLKLISILDAADKAMDDSGQEFTQAERLENYFLALEFAGKQYFPSDFVSQYVMNILKSKKKIT